MFRRYTRTIITASAIILVFFVFAQNPDKKQSIQNNLNQYLERKTINFQFSRKENKLKHEDLVLGTRRYINKENSSKKPDFVEPRNVKHFADHITVGLTIINKRGEKELEKAFEFKMKLNLVSLLTYSSGDPLHFVIITDKNSIENVDSVLKKIMKQYVAEGIISTKWRRIRAIPNIKLSYVDCEEITEINSEFFTAMKNNSQQGYSQKQSYTEDLFYIAPIYHKAFSSLDRIIFLDSKDLEFRSDIKLLEKQFDQMPSEAVIGIAPDLTPHYHQSLSAFIAKNPSTSLGQPGPGRQGYNSGVVLYRLDRMRQDPVYNKYITPEGVDVLMNKYLYKMFLAEQDWLTNLGFSHPHLFYNLPCQFNRQTSISMLTDSWKDIFDKYHSCDLPTNIKIYHRNGCGPTPRSCHNLLSNSAHTSQLHDLNINIDGFWESIASLRTWNSTKYGSLSKLSYILADTVYMNCVMEAMDYCMDVRNLKTSMI